LATGGEIRRKSMGDPKGRWFWEGQRWVWALPLSFVSPTIPIEAGAVIIDDCKPTQISPRFIRPAII